VDLLIGHRNRPSGARLNDSDFNTRSSNRCKARGTAGGANVYRSDSIKGEEIPVWLNQLRQTGGEPCVAHRDVRDKALTIHTILIEYSDFAMNENILFVGNDSIQTRGFVQAVRGVGLAARLLPDAGSTLAMLKDRCLAVVVLDKALPDMSGLDLCRIIKSRTRSIFVLLLLDNVHDQLNAFGLGAVDCVVKPFNIPKLVLQVRNLLWSIGDSITTEALKVGDLLLDRARHEVRAANCVVNCTPKEFLLIGALMERSGRVQTREQLLNDVWDNDSEISPRAIDRHAGYRLVPDGQIAA
jgi:two-component system, OmpR family, phosphate regulon response regulator PhoB